MEEESTKDSIETVEQIVIDFGDICRFCLTETSNNISLSNKLSPNDPSITCNTTISEFVTELTSVKTECSDGFPFLVCENCFNIINMCFEFRESCRQADLSLRDCYVKTLEEAKAKFSLNNIAMVNVVDNEPEKIASVKNKVDPKCFMTNLDIGNSEGTIGSDKIVAPCEYSVKDVNDDIKDSEYINMNLKLRLKKKKKNSLSVLRAGTIKQKYQRINSLSERLKEAQAKLVEDILRTKDIMSNSLKTDVSTNKDKIKYFCPHCQSSFVTSDMLTYHFITSHIKENKIQRSFHIYQCKVCKKEFNSTYQLIGHYKNLHKIPPSKLSAEYLVLKNKKLSSESFQCLHDQTSQTFKGKNDFPCEIMEETQLDENSYGIGAKKPSQSKFYSCTICESKQPFATKFSLNRHMMNIHKMDKSEITVDHTEKFNIKAESDMFTGPSRNDDNDQTPAPGLHLLKIYVCLDCSPPTSFSDVSRFIDHKTESHYKNLEDVSLKELTPVYVESVNVFQNIGQDNDQTFKVICKSCDGPVEFYTASDFVRHMKKHHGNVPNEKWDVETKFSSYACLQTKAQERIWKCTECPATYIRKHSLHYHLREKHNKILRLGAVKCPEEDCNASFFTNRQVIHHGITAHGKYFANLHKVFKDKILQETVEKDLRVPNFECDICQKKYLGKTSLKRHILKAHFGKADAESAICPYCGKTFSNKLNLKSHIDFVHEALFVSCPICKKNINFKTIGKHYKIHQVGTEFEVAAKNRYLCNQCGRVLKSKSGFEDHQKLHMNVRDQICDICGSGFTTKKNLYIHKKAHDSSQKKVFECDKCDKVFSGKHTLNRHILTHSGQKNFICEICSKRFYTLQELNRHVRYHKKEYRFDCQMCDMRFLDRSRFRHHMMRHRNIRPHKCHFCDKVFIVRRKMNLHMAARHNVEVQNTKAIWKDPKTYIPLDDLL